MDRSILLVDDDPNFRRALAVGLRLEGFRVEEAASVQEARRRLTALAFELVVVELLLPLGDALDLVDHLQARHPRTRPVLCSARPEAFVAARRRAQGVRLLDKPFTVEALLALLDEAPSARNANGSR